MNFSTMTLSLTVGISAVTVALLTKSLGLGLNEIQTLATNNLNNFCKEVSVKQFKKLLRKHKNPATVVVVRDKADICTDTS